MGLQLSQLFFQPMTVCNEYVVEFLYSGERDLYLRGVEIIALQQGDNLMLLSNISLDFCDVP